jgi:hypothetical protein
MTLTIEQIDEAVETLDILIEQSQPDWEGWSVGVDTIRTALEMAKGSVWQPIDDWCEERGDVAIVLFTNDKHLLYCTLFTTPLCSNFPDLEEHGLYGYFKTVDMSDLYPTPPKESE